ncbi:MAG: ABC transporter permease [Candidatus Marinimicrobia bacterium]|nr:ABC transporter permease [Candidatus Neomarinimicrobiota bacterium]MCF7851412.1 ABC transporter permease [Candidatus Neomarinimicrobiota bacterium]MCF7905323.1 ABC transporter permease [Candidatus Neomarinimicrobiota bacterium]
MTFLKIAWFEYYRRIRSKWFIIGTFGMPIVILGISMLGGYLTGSGAGLETKYFGVIDETARYGAQLRSALDERYADVEDAPIDLAIAQGTFDELHTQYDVLVKENSLDGYFYIPAEFSTETTLRFYGRSSATIRQTEIIEGILGKILTSERANALDLSMEVLDDLMVDVVVDHYDLGASQAKETEELVAGWIAPFVFMFLLFLGIFTGGQLLMRAVLEERSSRVIEVLLSTVSYNDLMGGKIVGLGMLGLTQSAIYLMAGAAAGAYYDVNVITAGISLLYVIYFVLGYLLYAGVYIGVGALFDSEQEAQQAIQIITFIAVIPIMLWTLVIENPNSLIVNLLCYLPPVTPFFMMIKISVGATSATQVLITIALMAASVYLSIRMAAKLFKTGILLYGKRVTLPEIIRWIKA